MVTNKWHSPKRARKFIPSNYKALAVLMGACRAMYGTRTLQQTAPNLPEIAVPRTSTHEHKADRHQESRICCRPARISCSRPVRENIWRNASSRPTDRHDRTQTACLAHTTLGHHTQHHLTAVGTTELTTYWHLATHHFVHTSIKQTGTSFRVFTAGRLTCRATDRHARE